MRLAAFIRSHSGPIVMEWQNFAQTLFPGATGMGSLALRDHIQEILVFIANDIESAQNAAEQIEKAQGKKSHSVKMTAAESHASIRHAAGFNMDQMVSEYRALRASIIALWQAQLGAPTASDMEDLTRFNESIDQALTESICDYTKKIDSSRNLFLGILSHDLRSPISAIRMAGQLIAKIGPLNDRQSLLAGQVVSCSDRATEIVSHLLDLTRARFGSGIPVVRKPLDMGALSEIMVDEARLTYPKRVFILRASGDLKGAWDSARIGQIFSNLLGNAVQYGSKDSAINVSVHGLAKDVTLCVHNMGVPIRPEEISSIFDSLVRASDDGFETPDQDANPKPSLINLGLGLYIAKEIAVAHGGTISVTSSENDGTAFTIRLPRA